MAPMRRRYRGFISYSQQDARKADRLHKALERYHVPEGLAPDQVDPRRRRLGRFFRDMEDMSAAADISATVRGAIEDSECLIVVCSPRSAKSRWVAGEIEHFRQLGRGERIYAVIIDGEPNSGDPETECFPPALRVDAGVEPRPDAMPIEPVGIDLRKQSMARACARIAAGLLDLRFDDLWQRDRRDAQRRLLIGGGSAATALIGVFAAFFLTGADRLRAFSAQRSMDFANAARSASERGDLDAAARFALAGIMGADMPVFGFDASAAEAELRRALAAGPFRYAVADAGAVAFSPDGSRMVTGHRSGEAVVSDARTGRAIARLSETHGVPTSVFSPDGQAVLTFDESSNARIWDPTTGRELAALRGHRGAIVKASFDRTGRRVVTVSADGGARIWDGASGRQIVELRNPDDPILEAWFLPNRGLVLTATYQGAMQTWDGASGRVTSVWRALSAEQRVRHILLSPDGTRLYVHSEFPSDGADPANGLLLLFAPNGQAIAELNAEADPLESAAFSSDSRLLAVGQIDGTVQVWATRNGAPRARVGERSSPLPDGTLAPRPVEAVAFMPDGSLLLSRVATDRCPRLWRLSNDEVPLLSETNAPCGGEQIIPNRDGSLIALTSHVGGVQLWSAASPSRLEILPGALSEFGFSDDGSRLFSASARQTRVWDVASRELLADIADGERCGPSVWSWRAPNRHCLARSGAGLGWGERR